MIPALRGKPLKEAMSLIEQHFTEKESQCKTHCETTEKITEKVGIIDRQVLMIKYGAIATILNILVTAGNIIFQLIKKG